MTEFRDCENSRCRWYGLLAECFVPMNDSTPLCPECGTPTVCGRRGAPMPREEPAYAVAGPGYGGSVRCLKEACAIVAKHKAGAVYQKLWDYEPYIAGESLRNEITCSCAACTPQQKQEG